MTAARTRVVSNILQAPGTGKPLANKQVSIRLNVPAFIDSGTVEKARTTYLTTDANGEWTATLEVNADIDPAGSWYTVQELAGVIWTFVVTAGDLSPTTLRACLVDNPPNPTPLTAGIQSVQPGTNVTVDNTDPSNPIVSATAGGGSVTITSPDSSITVGGSPTAPTVEVTPGQFATFAQGAKADAAATQTALNTEASTRATADTANALAITSEATRAQNAEALLAPLASPTFTGHVAVPTPTSSSDAATKSYVDGLVTGLYDLRGTYDASVNTFPASGGSGSAGAVVKGDTWVVSVAGTLGSKAVAVGDVVTAVVDTPGQTAANWSIIEHDLGYTPLNAASNLSDLTNAGTARTNLGLGTAATHPATDFDTAGFTTSDKTRLANTSGNNTGDQDLSSYATTAAVTAGLAGKVSSVTSPDGSIAVGGTATAPTLSGISASNLLLGTTGGVLKKPWGEQAFIGPELWTTSLMSTDSVGAHGVGNTSTITPSVTGNGTAHSIYTRFRVGYTTADGTVQESYRFDYTLSNTCPSGWAYIAIRGLNSSGTTVSGSEIYLWGASDGQVTGYRSALDYTVAANSAIRWVEVEVGVASNVASGTIGLSNVSFRQVAAARPQMQVSWFNAGAPGPSGTTGYACCDIPVTDPVTGAVNYLRKAFGTDGQLQVSPTGMVYSPIGYTNNYTKPSSASLSNFCASNNMSTVSNRNLHITNNGQIMGVVKTGGSTELRCNTHGGEWGRRVRTVTDGVINGTTTVTSATANFTSADVGAAISLGTGMPVSTSPVFISSVTNSTTVVISIAATTSASGVTMGIGNFASNFVFEMDFGDGTWHALTDGAKTHGCRRFRITSHTEVCRSDNTGSPFANIDNTFTVFDDGTVRFDRTITFLASQQMYQWFYFMHTFDNGTPLLEPGRLGYGQQVITGFDPRQYLTTPAAPTASNASTGGTYGALTRTYSVTAITPQGESLASATVTSTTASGTTNAFTVTMPSSQSGQTAWGVYDTTGRLAVIPVAQTTFTDANPTYGTAKAPTVSSAYVLPGAQQFGRLMSDRADWVAFCDVDSTNVVFGTITDRDNALTYPGAVALTAEIDSHNGVLKNYWQLHDGTGWQPVSTASAATGGYQQTISSGTVLTTTAYSFTYAPLNRTDWHREIANRGQGFKQFSTVYPST